MNKRIRSRSRSNKKIRSRSNKKIRSRSNKRRVSRRKLNSRKTRRKLKSIKKKKINRIMKGGVDIAPVEEDGAVRIGGSEWTEKLEQYASEDEETTEKVELQKKFNEIEKMHRMKMVEISKLILFY